MVRSKRTYWPLYKYHRELVAYKEQISSSSTTYLTIHSKVPCGYVGATIEGDGTHNKQRSNFEMTKMGGHPTITKLYGTIF